MRLGWEVAGFGPGHCGPRCRRIHPGGRGGQAQGLSRLSPCRLSSFLHPPRQLGPSWKPKSPHSNPLLLVCRPPRSRSPMVFRRPPLLGLQPCCFASAAGSPSSAPPASTQTPPPPNLVPCPRECLCHLGSPTQPPHCWLRSFPAAARVGIPAARGRLPTA